MHGDNLPAIFAKNYIDKHIMKGNRQWYIRRRALALDFNIELINPIQVIRECRGDVFARRIHESAGKPLNEVYSENNLDPTLVQATISYYAKQRQYIWGGVKFLPVPINKWVVEIDGKYQSFSSFSQATMHYITHEWPESVLDII